MEIVRSGILIFFALTVSLLGAKALNVTKWNYDLGSTGVNPDETILTPANVNSNSFGQIFDEELDGQTYAQPLYLSGVTIPGQGVHNVVYVVTLHDSVYAFDADTPNQSVPLWHTSFLSTNVTSVPDADTGASDVEPEIGILSTPVIDPSTGTIYVVAKTKETGTGQNHYVYRLHALDVTTGSEKFGGPYTIADTTLTSSNTFVYNSGPSVAGTGPDSVDGTIYFNALRENQRPALLLYNGVVYVAWGSNGDVEYYHGWLTAYNAQTLQPVANELFVTTPDGSEGGIWGAGAGPVIDSSGNLYVTTANGSYNGTTDWAMSVCKFAPSTNFTAPTDWFAPSDEATLSTKDLDQGSCGTLIIPDQTGIATPHMILAGGKSGQIYLLNRDNLGHEEVTQPLQVIDNLDLTSVSQIYASPAFFNNTLYYNRDGQVIKAIKFANGLFSSTVEESSNSFGNRGGGPIISANGTTNGVLWIMDNGGPGQLMAYDATALANGTNTSPIYSVELPANGVKFTHPLVVNGKVYATSAFTNGTGATGHLTAFAMLNSVGLSTAPTNLTAYSLAPNTVNLSWTASSTGAPVSYVITRQSGTGVYEEVASVVGSQTSYVDTTLTGQTLYNYAVYASNNAGNSGYSNIAQVLTASYVTTPGLVGYWPFDEGNGTATLDYTGRGHIGTLEGECSWVQGLIGSAAINFHSAGYAFNTVDVPDSADFHFTAAQSFTVSAWAQELGIGVTSGSNPRWAGVVAKSRNTASGGYGIYVNEANQWAFRTGTTDTDSRDIIGPTVKTGTWQQIVAVQDGVAGTRTLYVDGVPVATGAAQDGTGTGDLWIGEGDNAPDYEGFEGNIDDVHIFNRALSAGEIASLPRPAATFPSGFASGSTMTLNGAATIVGSKLQLTSGLTNQKGSAFFFAPVNVQSFTTNFSFQLVNPKADGMAFVIQGIGANALGGQAGYLGYAGIGKSIAIKFDLSNNLGGSANATGLYENGVAPYNPAINLTPSGINLRSGHVFNAQVTYDGTNLTLIVTDATNSALTFSQTFPLSNLPEIVGGNVAYVGFTGGTGAATVTSDILSWNYYPGVETGPTFYQGFTETTDLMFNGSAALNGINLELTNGQMNEAGSTFFTTPVDVADFTTNFSFQFAGSTVSGSADGFTFTIQGHGPNALGGTGGELGYEGISDSIAVKFDLYNHGGDGLNSTGVYVNGADPTVPATDLTSSKINLHTNHLFNVQITGTGSTITVVIKDATTNTGSFTHTYTLPASIKSIVGNTGYVGFTGGTGAGVVTTNILNWSYTPGAVTAPSYPSGFTNVSSLTFNGVAAHPASTQILQLTNSSQTDSAGSVFYSTPVNIQAFTTTFSFQFLNAVADGMTFTMQGDGPTALGGVGGGLGYGGIAHSVAVKFDIFNNYGEGNDSTGVYLNGAPPSLPATDLISSGIVLSNGKPLTATITYDGYNMTLTLRDTLGHVFSQNYMIGDITSIVGGETAYVGFTGADGGSTVTTEIQNWTYTPATP